MRSSGRVRGKPGSGLEFLGVGLGSCVVLGVGVELDFV